MEEILAENIITGLDQLEKTSIWVFVTLIVVFVSSFQSEKTIEIGKLKLPRNKSGLILYIVLCALNFQILKILQGISNSFNALQNREKVILEMQIHHWVFNPFSKTDGIIGMLTDNVGLILLIVIWWFGLSLSNVEVLSEEKAVSNKKIAPILFFTYLILGLFSLVLIQDILIKIGGYEIRIISQIIGILLGFYIFYLISKKHNLLKKLFAK